MHLRQSTEVNFKSCESRLSEKVYTEVQASLIIYIYLELGGVAQKWRKKVMTDFYSSIQNASIDASLFREGFLEEATEAERHDGHEIALPPSMCGKMFHALLCT